MRCGHIDEIVIEVFVCLGLACGAPLTVCSRTLRTRLYDGMDVRQYLQLMRSTRLPAIADWYLLEKILVSIRGSVYLEEAIMPRAPTVLTYVNSLHALNYMPRMNPKMVKAFHQSLIIEATWWSVDHTFWTCYWLTDNFYDFAQHAHSWSTPNRVMLWDVLMALMEKAVNQKIEEEEILAATAEVPGEGQEESYWS